MAPRLQLRPFGPSDAHAAHRVYSDERVMRCVANGAVPSIEETSAMLSEYIDHQRLHGFSVWAVTEAAGLCVRAAFAELQLPRLIALIRPENEPSAAVAAKLGFTPAERVSAYGSDQVLYRLTAQVALAAAPSSGASGGRSPDG